MSTRVKFLNTQVDNFTMQETVMLINESISQGNRLQHVVVNAGKIVAMQTDDELRESVNNCDLINADGMAVVWASKVLGKPLKERVAGIDLMENLIELAYKENYKVYFLGAKEEIVSKVVNHYSKKYSKDLIAGYRNGYFSKEEEQDIAKDIEASEAQLLFVAISSPKKENFLYQNKEHLSKVNFTMGVGGSFDVVSGLVKRAPLWMQNNGLEWFYRFAQEPQRMWKRYLVGNSKFLYLVFKERLKK
ncbi:MULTISPECIES: WecB/TagA/CpsF family glycosyltransferase [Bizionia]|uniref:WecB/TagA/CpsF family glycosyltransferase n=1 Tax=Bizionia algoritergicola TaxID=291187 RepID=A0A5D0R0N0_9FLAO|nr:MULTISPECIES: WecB/TagA/CpsF family glycosyltransferase [Bizionia]OBX21651.1 UDP-N-acetyl-D-mannosamine transferase [Bizionia sp. APA-3]TYB75082.1 WecB/TagA/CpsF family glycosyltransferase [Bizionia algoritergicola]